MPDIRRERVAVDVGGPFVFGRVGVARADVSRLELFELLLGAEFVGLWGGRGIVSGGEAEGRRGGEGRGEYHFL